MLNTQVLAVAVLAALSPAVLIIAFVEGAATICLGKSIIMANNQQNVENESNTIMTAKLNKSILNQNHNFEFFWGVKIILCSVQFSS